jgi:hypothetical protein
MRGYWPLQTTTTRSRRTSSLEHSRTRAGERCTVLRGPLLDQVRELKARPGKDIVATGSMSLMPVLVWSGLVDEYRLFPDRPRPAGFARPEGQPNP